MNPVNPFRSLQSAAITAFLLLLLACSHRTPQATVEVIDTSLSITPHAEKTALDAILNQIAHMQRQDTLVIIPITGDAVNNTGGRILRLSVPSQRETYDTDLRRFHEQARYQFLAWTASLDPRPARTDILGALDVAQQELGMLPKESNPKLIVVSDFLEDDGTYRFVTASELTTPERARQLGAQLREQRGFKLPSVPLCLGRLESTDLAHLSAQRRDAVNAFWTAYSTAGQEPGEIQFDGTGVLANAGYGCSSGKR